MKTYQPQLTGAIMFIEADDGEWVKRSDYDALAAELARVKATLDKVRGTGIDPNYHGDPVEWEQKDQISTLRAIAAILYPQPIRLERWEE